MIKGRFRFLILQIMIIIVVFSLILPGNLAAKRNRKGVRVEILKIGGERISGELMLVKDESLILKDSATQEGVTLYFKEVNTVTIKRKPKKHLQRVLIITGGLIGAALGGISAYNSQYSKEEEYEGGFVGLVSGVATGIAELMKPFAVAGAACLGGAVGMAGGALIAHLGAPDHNLKYQYVLRRPKIKASIRKKLRKYACVKSN